MRSSDWSSDVCSSDLKTAIKEGRIPADWTPAKVRQKDRDARWSIKYTKAKVQEGADSKASRPVDLAIPMFGYKNHIGIDRAHRQIGRASCRDRECQSV